MPLTKTGIVQPYQIWTLNTQHWVPMRVPATIGAGVVSTTVQARLPTPTNYKVSKVGVAFGAIDALTGGNSFNLVVGTGTYETGATSATDSAVWTGTPNHDGTVTVTVAGHAVVYTEVSGDTTPTLVMAHTATAVNNDATVGLLVTATSSTGTLTVTWKDKGPVGNGQTLTVATTDSGSVTFVAASATFSGGANGTAITTGTNDNSYSGPPTGGLGFPTNFAVAGNALFASDVIFNTTNFPGATTSGGSGVLIPTNYDVAYPIGIPLTLRVTTDIGAGSIADLEVNLFVETLALRATETPSPTDFLPVPGQAF